MGFRKCSIRRPYLYLKGREFVSDRPSAQEKTSKPIHKITDIQEIEDSNNKQLLIWYHWVV